MDDAHQNPFHALNLRWLHEFVDLTINSASDLKTKNGELFGDSSNTIIQYLKAVFMKGV